MRECEGIPRREAVSLPSPDADKQQLVAFGKQDYRISRSLVFQQRGRRGRRGGSCLLVASLDAMLIIVSVGKVQEQACS